MCHYRKDEADNWEVQLCNITGEPCSVDPSSRRRLDTVSGGNPSSKHNVNVPARANSAYGDIQVALEVRISMGFI